MYGVTYILTGKRQNMETKILPGINQSFKFQPPFFQVLGTRTVELGAQPVLQSVQDFAESCFGSSSAFLPSVLNLASLSFSYLPNACSGASSPGFLMFA